MKLFKKLMLLKCFEISCIYNIVEDYLSEVLGEEFLARPFIKIEDVFLQSSCKRPIIFIMTPGTDPYADIMHLATKHNTRNKLLMSSLGSKEKLVQRSMVLEAMSKGLWVVYQNCHLDIDFVIEIDKLLQSTTELNENFRLWLITELSNEFPSRVVKSSIKVTTETSDDFKTKMEDTYTKTSEEYLNSFNYPALKPILYALTLFHCIILERKKYGSLGWNIMYQFGNSDYKMAIQTIQEYLNRNIDFSGGNIPWEALKCLIGDIIYGGHMIDKYDRRIILCYIDEIFDGDMDDYIEEIKKLPTMSMAKILGLHPNLDLKYYQDAVKMVWKNLSLHHSSKGLCSSTNKEDIVFKSIKTVLHMLPTALNIKDIRGNSNVPTMPTVTVLLHELQRMNILIDKIFQSSTTLTHVITGQVSMNEEMESMFTYIYNNELPITWRLLAPETCKNLPNWISHLVQRVDEYKKWILLCPVLPVMWLSGLHKPQSLFVALIQEASLKIETSLENIVMCSNITSEYDPEKIQDLAEMGCYIKGLFIEGAGWNSKNNSLGSLKPNMLYEPLPVLMMLPIEKLHSKYENTLKIPVYATNLRNSSGNGLVFEVELKSSKHKSQSILLGMCILLNID
ncbi:dynein axonemal heavy chain 10 isoform X1 [Halyomorpha halys]|uniref:dynein axonemal heavy chain 10 isoform X1 n=1 Tax=Halyomorpha halys TaxID=286706 RepID=UPI0034D1ED4F